MTALGRRGQPVAGAAMVRSGNDWAFQTPHRSGPGRSFDDEYDRLASGEIVAPEHANPVSASDVPHLQSDVLVLDTLDIETDRGIVLTTSPSFSL